MGSAGRSALTSAWRCRSFFYVWTTEAEQASEAALLIVRPRPNGATQPGTALFRLWEFASTRPQGLANRLPGVPALGLHRDRRPAPRPQSRISQQARLRCAVVASRPGLAGRLPLCAGPHPVLRADHGGERGRPPLCWDPPPRWCGPPRPSLTHNRSRKFFRSATLAPGCTVAVKVRRPHG